MPSNMRRSLLLLAAAAPLALGACAASIAPSFGPERSPASGAAKRPSECDAELGAFVAVMKLARQAEDWTIYQPAIEALKDQIMDCVQDSYGATQSI
jgi:hypothetical protein